MSSMILELSDSSSNTSHIVCKELLESKVTTVNVMSLMLARLSRGVYKSSLTKYGSVLEHLKRENRQSYVQLDFDCLK